MDFAARRERAIAHARKELREALSDDEVIVLAYRCITQRPRALEHWLHAVLPHHHAREAREAVLMKGAGAHDENGFGARMSEAGWELLTAACKEDKIDIEPICEAAVPNLHALLGAMESARLLDASGGLARLAKMTQRDCQMVGNEAGQFGGKNRNGILAEHELATNERALRILCSRTVLAARLDLYKGQFKGESLRQEVLYAQ